jgi:hypothetical protein
VEVDYPYGFSADLGGGEYERGDTLAGAATVRVPDDHATIQAALDALGGSGVVEIADSGRYEETLSVNVSTENRIELRAANGWRPTVVLTGESTLSGGAGSEIRLNGLLVAGARLRVPAAGGNALRRLDLVHCTLVPGWSLEGDGSPAAPVESSLIVDIADVIVTAERAILGAVRVHEGSEVRLRDSILDACSPAGVAYAATDGAGPGGALSTEACTVIGMVHARTMPLISNSMLIAALEPASTWPAPVIAARRQEGCVRFSYVPLPARVPQRFRCVPEAGAPGSAVPQFTSLRYGHHGYAQLRPSAGPAPLRGASDEGEMGAFHHLYQAQRETNVRMRLDEYLRVGLEAGVFHES